MASFQKAGNDNWLWCLYVYSNTGRTTQTALAFFFFYHGWCWNKEHIAGGGPPEQKKRENAKKKNMQASLTYWVTQCVYVCAYPVHFVTLLILPKNAQLRLVESPPGHTLAQQWHLLCGCMKIFGVFFPHQPSSYCLWVEMRTSLQSDYDQIRISSTYISYFKLPLACEVTIFRKIVLSFFFRTEEAFLICRISIWAHHFANAKH